MMISNSAKLAGLMVHLGSPKIIWPRGAPPYPLNLICAVMFADTPFNKKAGSL
jgi:hypothetical protein